MPDRQTLVIGKKKIGSKGWRALRGPLVWLERTEREGNSSVQHAVMPARSDILDVWLVFYLFKKPDVRLFSFFLKPFIFRDQMFGLSRHILHAVTVLRTAPPSMEWFLFWKQCKTSPASHVAMLWLLYAFSDFQGSKFYTAFRSSWTGLRLIVTRLWLV